jgi:hypothetical protein
MKVTFDCTEEHFDLWITQVLGFGITQALRGAITGPKFAAALDCWLGRPTASPCAYIKYPFQINQPICSLQC